MSFLQRLQEEILEILTIAEHDAEKTACPHRQSRDRTALVYLLCRHLEEERLNREVRGGAYHLNISQASLLRESLRKEECICL
jgi:hypothetical protein